LDNLYACHMVLFLSVLRSDKTRQAFQIIKMLEEKKMIKLTSVKKFMELVDEIYTVL